MEYDGDDKDFEIMNNILLLQWLSARVNECCSQS